MTLFFYNALGQRIEISGGVNGTVLYAYDEAGHLLGEYDGIGALIEETVWLGDTPVATLRPSGSTVSIYYVHSDALNTPREITRPSDNTPMWTWNSDPFGTDAANGNPAGAGTFAYNLRFPGQLFDGQAGLHANGFRDYDPAIGRYPTADPYGLAGGLNSYSYSAMNPLSNFDPLGLYCTSDSAWTTCAYPGGPNFRLPTPPGFPTYLGPDGFLNKILYHRYDISRSIGCANPGAVMQGLINEPTPGNPSPATPNGTLNNAEVVPGWDNWVKSYVTNDLVTGQQLEVNLTLGSASAFDPGYVVRTVSNGVAHAYGEGTNWTQSPWTGGGFVGERLANEFVWGRQLSNIIRKTKCGCGQ